MHIAYTTSTVHDILDKLHLLCQLGRTHALWIKSGTYSTQPSNPIIHEHNHRYVRIFTLLTVQFCLFYHRLCESNKSFASLILAANNGDPPKMVINYTCTYRLRMDATAAYTCQYLVTTIILCCYNRYLKNFVQAELRTAGSYLLLCYITYPIILHVVHAGISSIDVFEWH